MSDSPELIPTAILAGGLATRLRPLTETTPKALIEVNGKPFLWHQLEFLKRSGIHRIVLLVGHLGEKIQERFADGAELGLKIEYSFDGPSLLGTAGAIRHALPLLPQRFFVLYGDSYLTCNYRAVETAFIKSGCAGLMTVFRNDGMYDTSNVEFDGVRIVRYDKVHCTSTMHHIDYGLGAFERSVFAAIPEEGKRDLATVYQGLLRTGNLAAYEVHERFYEIGSAAGLLETSEFLAGG
jgi:NDP-sugar pyrophosphorylase family protein